jgi:predicted CoA-binding protein
LTQLTDLGTRDAVVHILDTYQAVAVVGLSPKPHRDSFEVAQYLQSKGWHIIPINPNAATILGERAYPSLCEAAKHEHIGLVNVFRNSADVPPVMDDAIAIGATAIWLQLGIVHEASAALARQAGMMVVQDKCILVEHRCHCQGR